MQHNESLVRHIEYLPTQYMYIRLSLVLLIQALMQHNESLVSHTVSAYMYMYIRLPAYPGSHTTQSDSGQP